MVGASSVNPTYTRGDVVLCDLNPVVGTEQAGIRPVVILQIDRANAVSPLILRFFEISGKLIFCYARD